MYQRQNRQQTQLWPFRRPYCSERYNVKLARFRRYMASLVASASAMYSASHEYNATVDCSVLMKTDTISDEGVPAAGIAD